MRPRIIGVGHDAYRAGSQIAFLQNLAWLRDSYDADLAVVLAAGGELLADFQATVPTTNLGRTVGDTEVSFAGKLRQQATQRVQSRRRVAPPGGADLVYANSTASVGLAAQIAVETGAPVLCHVHELELSMRRFAGGFDDVKHHISRYIAVCGAVRENLVENHGVDGAAVDVINPAIATPRLSRSTEQERLTRRAELGISSDAFVVGGCGTGDWRKAPEVFLLIAAALARRPLAGSISFLWLGGDPDQLALIRHDIERLGLQRTVSFIGPRPDPAAYFELFDVFLLPSREDPFPLVCLEAASLGVPVVCFADAGGMPEFVAADAGFVVPYLDVEAAADRIEMLSRSPELRTALGARAAQKVAELHSIDVAGPKLAAVLDRCLGRVPVDIVNAPATTVGQGRR